VDRKTGKKQLGDRKTPSLTKCDFLMELITSYIQVIPCRETKEIIQSLASNSQTGLMLISQATRNDAHATHFSQPSIAGHGITPTLSHTTNQREVNPDLTECILVRTSPECENQTWQFVYTVAQERQITSLPLYFLLQETLTFSGMVLQLKRFICTIKQTSNRFPYFFSWHTRIS